jgi:hypothetical protein
MMKKIVNSILTALLVLTVGLIPVANISADELNDFSGNNWSACTTTTNWDTLAKSNCLENLSEAEETRALALAKNTSMTSTILGILAKSKFEAVRLAVAQNKNTNAQTLATLAQDDSEEVQNAARDHTNYGDDPIFDCAWYDVGCGLKEVIAVGVARIVESSFAVWQNISTTAALSQEGTAAFSDSYINQTDKNGNGLSDILSWIVWIGAFITAVALIVFFSRLMAANKQGDGFEHVTKFLWIISGLVIVTAASKVVQLIFDTNPASIEGTSISTAIVRQIWPFVLVSAIVSLMIAAIKTIIDQKGEHLKNIGITFLKLLIFSQLGTAGIYILASVGDSFSDGVFSLITHGESSIGRYMSKILFDGDSFLIAGAGLLVLLISCIAIFILSLVQAVIMIIRNVMLVLLLAFIVFWVPWQDTQVGKQAFNSSFSWLIAFLLYKPIASLIYFVGFQFLNTTETDDVFTSFVYFLVTMLLSIFALPALMKLVTGGQGMGGGGGLGMAMSSMMMMSMMTGGGGFGGFGKGKGKGGGGGGATGADLGLANAGGGDTSTAGANMSGGAEGAIATGASIATGGVSTVAGGASGVADSVGGAVESGVDTASTSAQGNSASGADSSNSASGGGGSATSNVASGANTSDGTSSNTADDSSGANLGGSGSISTASNSGSPSGAGTASQSGNSSGGKGGGGKRSGMQKAMLGAAAVGMASSGVKSGAGLEDSNGSSQSAQQLAQASTASSSTAQGASNAPQDTAPKRSGRLRRRFRSRNATGSANKDAAQGANLANGASNTSQPTPTATGKTTASGTHGNNSPTGTAHGTSLSRSNAQSSNASLPPQGNSNSASTARQTQQPQPAPTTPNTSQGAKPINDSEVIE